jgi:hypothetical protein
VALSTSSSLITIVKGRWFISLAVLTLLSQGISGDNAPGTSSLNGDIVTFTDQHTRFSHGFATNDISYCLVAARHCLSGLLSNRTRVPSKLVHRSCVEDVEARIPIEVKRYEARNSMTEKCRKRAVREPPPSTMGMKLNMWTARRLGYISINNIVLS